MFLEEKRPFFLEGVSIFNTPVPLLYTRSIVDPIAGLKLSGREGPWSFGLFSAWDQLPLGSRVVEPTRASGFEDLTGKDAVNTVGRLSLDLGGGSRIGLFTADKTVRDRDDRRASPRATTWWRRTPSSPLQASTTSSRRWPARTSTSAGSGDGTFSGLFYDLTARRRDRNLFLELSSEYYSEGFRAETSPITRVNIIPSSATATYRIYTGLPALPYVEPGVQLATVHEPSTLDLLDTSVKPSIAARLGENTDLSLSYSRGDGDLHPPLRQASISGTSESRATRGTSSRWRQRSGPEIRSITTRRTRSSAGPWRDRSAARSSRRATPSSSSITPGASSRAPMVCAQANVNLYYAKLGISFSTRLSLRVIAQLDTYENALRNSAVLAYQIYPGTELFVGYQESDDVAGRHPSARPASVPEVVVSVASMNRIYVSRAASCVLLAIEPRMRSATPAARRLASAPVAATSAVPRGVAVGRLRRAGRTDRRRERRGAGRRFRPGPSAPSRTAALMEALAIAVRRRGAFPLLTLTSERLERRMYEKVPEKYDDSAAGARAEAGGDALGHHRAGPRVRGGLSRRAARAHRQGVCQPARAARRVIASVASARSSVGNELYPSRARAERYGMPYEALARNYWRGLAIDAAVMRARADWMRDTLASARMIEVTNPNGTRITMSIAGQEAAGQRRPALR